MLSAIFCFAASLTRSSLSLSNLAFLALASAGSFETIVILAEKAASESRNVEIQSGSLQSLFSLTVSPGVSESGATYGSSF
jgi:hypothetical protein